MKKFMITLSIIAAFIIFPATTFAEGYFSIGGGGGNNGSSMTVNAETISDAAVLISSTISGGDISISQISILRGRGCGWKAWRPTNSIFPSGNIRPISPVL